MKNVNEGRSQIKRKYGEHANIRVNEKAPIRNKIINFVGKRFITEDELKAELTKLTEERGKDFDQRKWFANNKKYFESFENRGQKVWTLSKYGKRIHEFINKPKETNVIMENRIGLFKTELFESFRNDFELNEVASQADIKKVEDFLKKNGKYNKEADVYSWKDETLEFDVTLGFDNVHLYDGEETTVVSYKKFIKDWMNESLNENALAAKGAKQFSDVNLQVMIDDAEPGWAKEFQAICDALGAKPKDVIQVDSETNEDDRLSRSIYDYLETNFRGTKNVGKSSSPGQFTELDPVLKVVRADDYGFVGFYFTKDSNF